jgi:hypothetical protein
MSMTEEEEIRVGRLEGEVDILRQRLDEVVNGIVDTIKNHPLFKDDKMSNIKSEKKDKTESAKSAKPVEFVESMESGKSVESMRSIESMESMEGSLQLFSPDGINKFLKLCDHLKSYVLKVLDSLDQTDEVINLENRLKNATVWDEVFDLSTLGIGEHLRQLEEKEDIKRGK